MYHFEISEKIDTEKWINNLLRNDYSTFYQNPEYLKKDSTRFPIFVYIYDENKSVKGQLALTVLIQQSTYSTTKLKKYMNFISKIGNRASWVSGPIIHSDNELEKNKILDLFFQAMEEIIEKYNLIILDGYSAPQNQNIDQKYLDKFQNNGFKIEKFVTFVFDMNKTVEELFKNVQKYMRVNINRAKKRGIKVIEIKSKNQLNDYYSLEKKWISTKGITTEKYEYNLEKDWQKIDIGNEKIFLAYQNEEVISGLKINHFNKIASPIRVLSTYSNLTSLGGPALTWHAIEWSKKSGMKTYDLTGGEAAPKDKNKIFAYEKKWGSLLKYKRKWGGNEQSYYHFIKVKKSFKYKIIRLLSKPDQIYRNYKHSKIKSQKKNKL